METARCGACMVFGHDEMTCPKHIVAKIHKQSGKIKNGFQNATKKAYCVILLNTSPKFQFSKPMKQVYKPLSKKDKPRTSGTKKIAKPVRSEVGTANHFVTFNSLEKGVRQKTLLLTWPSCCKGSD